MIGIRRLVCFHFGDDRPLAGRARAGPQANVRLPTQLPNYRYGHLWRNTARSILSQSVVPPTVKRHDTPFVVAMMSDALNRTFQDLRSKNEDARVKAAADVRTAVVLAARGDLTCHLLQQESDANSAQNSPPIISKNSTTTSTIVWGSWWSIVPTRMKRLEESSPLKS